MKGHKEESPHSGEIGCAEGPVQFINTHKASMGFLSCYLAFTCPKSTNGTSIGLMFSTISMNLGTVNFPRSYHKLCLTCAVRV